MRGVVQDEYNDPKVIVEMVRDATYNVDFHIISKIVYWDVLRFFSAMGFEIESIQNHKRGIFVAFVSKTSFSKQAIFEAKQSIISREFILLDNFNKKKKPRKLKRKNV